MFTVDIKQHYVKDLNILFIYFILFFKSFEVKSLKGSNMTNNAKICEKYCCKEPRCQAWTLRFQEASTSNCPESEFLVFFSLL